jgi:CheY-like chemotaxis protein
MSHSPAIMLTGTVGDKLADEALQMGAVDYLVKGKVTADGLSRAIRYVLARN